MPLSKNTSKSNNNSLTYYIISGWIIVIIGIFAFYNYHKENKNEFWAFDQSKNNTTKIVLSNLQNLSADELDQLYQTLSRIQNLEEANITNKNNLTPKEINNNNCLFLGSWNNLAVLKNIVPDTIVSFNSSTKTLRWKHKDGFYELPLAADPASMTYALALKIQTRNKQQSILFIQFDEIDQSLFLQYLLEPKTIETIQSSLEFSNEMASFIALFKMPKKHALSEEIEFLDAYILHP